MQLKRPPLLSPRALPEPVCGGAAFAVRKKGGWPCTTVNAVRGLTTTNASKRHN